MSATRLQPAAALLFRRKQLVEVISWLVLIVASIGVVDQGVLAMVASLRPVVRNSLSLVKSLCSFPQERSFRVSTN